MLHYASKYSDSMEDALLASTNAGGENVARGAVLGALLGAAQGVEGLPASLVEGLADHDAIAADIEYFMAALEETGHKM